VRRTIATAFVCGLLCASPAFAALTEDAARQAAGTFGQALRGADASRLRPLLPTRGKIQLRLVRLGPEEGFFSASQVEALLQNFFVQGSADAFELLRMEFEPERFALAHGRATVTDGEGRSARVTIHLLFQPEGERWVLREIRETPP
jgi:hypothetical protein